MRCRFSRFVVDVGNFCEEGYRKIKVVFTVRINLLQYLVYFVRLS